MGLLDDAIKEHLELKRRAGTDPTEVARMEQDALGPVVRGELPVEYHPEEAPVASEPEPPAVEEPAAEDLHPNVGQPTEEYDVEAVNAAIEAAPVREEAPPAEHEAPPARREEPPPAASEPAEGKSQEEILEQTPEFLQETPEHDRLWFEQAPPQEFDFDK